MSFLADKLKRVNRAVVTHLGDAGTFRSVLADETVPVDIVLDDLSSVLDDEFSFERSTSCQIEVDQLPWDPAQGDEVSLLGGNWTVDSWQVEHEMYLIELRSP